MFICRTGKKIEIWQDLKSKSALPESPFSAEQKARDHHY